MKIVTALCNVGLFMMVASPAFAAGPDLRVTAKRFLDSYALGDRAAVISMIDKGNIHVYGADLAEVASDLPTFENIFDYDIKLWNGAAKFGLITNVSSVRTKTLATLFFDAPFYLGVRPPIQIRFATVWRLKHGAWKLIQSTNGVPTVGQSAKELLRSPQ